MIDKETVERILNAADIVDVVSDFVHLRRRGSNYVGLCPFHNEKNALVQRFQIERHLQVFQLRKKAAAPSTSLWNMNKCPIMKR